MDVVETDLAIANLLAAETVPAAEGDVVDEEGLLPALLLLEVAWTFPTLSPFPLFKSRDPSRLLPCVLGSLSLGCLGCECLSSFDIVRVEFG